LLQREVASPSLDRNLVRGPSKPRSLAAMLKQFDAALAGAIDVIADDVTATVKSVKEQGVMRTLGDAVEDAAGLVAGGAKSAVTGIFSGKKGEKTVSTHSGVASGYADICAGGNRNGAYGGGAAFPYVPNGGGAAFPYTPNPSNGKPGMFGGGAKPKANIGSFGPGIGIALPGQGLPGTQGGVQVFAGQSAPPPPSIAPYAGPGAGPAAMAGQFRPPSATAGQFRPPVPYPAPSAAAPAPYASASPAPAPAATSSGKDGIIHPDELAKRFEVIVGKEPANSRCFDCGAQDHEWASVSFGIFLCISCAGHHRQLGTHISRIRSCKMDSWKEPQLQLFASGGNKRLADFFAANGVPESARYQRYATPAGEWYREAWIKNRTLGRPVPAPVQGVVVGPCIDNAAPAGPSSKTKDAGPPADLLDLGAAEVPAPAAVADLLDVGGGAVSSSGGGDLLDLGSGGNAAASKPADDLLGLAAVAASARPDASGLASLDFGAAPVRAPAPSPLAQATPFPAMPAPAPAAKPAAAAAPAALGANTLGGGARLAEPAKEEKAEDPFAMALKQWNM